MRVSVKVYVCTEYSTYIRYINNLTRNSILSDL